MKSRKYRDFLFCLLTRPLCAVIINVYVHVNENSPKTTTIKESELDNEKNNGISADRGDADIVRGLLEFDKRCGKYRVGYDGASFGNLAGGKTEYSVGGYGGRYNYDRHKRLV